MRSRNAQGRILRAALCEVERGLFHVSYRRDSHVDIHELPTYQLGTSASDAEQRVEQRAVECGFTAVMWDHPLDDIPQLSVSPKEISPPTSTQALSGGGETLLAGRVI